MEQPAPTINAPPLLSYHSSNHKNEPRTEYFSTGTDHLKTAKPLDDDLYLNLDHQVKTEDMTHITRMKAAKPLDDDLDLDLYHQIKTEDMTHITRMESGYDSGNYTPDLSIIDDPIDDTDIYSDEIPFEDSDSGTWSIASNDKYIVKPSSVAINHCNLNKIYKPTVKMPACTTESDQNQTIDVTRGKEEFEKIKEENPLTSDLYNYSPYDNMEDKPTNIKDKHKDLSNLKFPYKISIHESIHLDKLCFFDEYIPSCPSSRRGTKHLQGLKKLTLMLKQSTKLTIMPYENAYLYGFIKDKLNSILNAGRSLVSQYIFPAPYESEYKDITDYVLNRTTEAITVENLEVIIDWFVIIMLGS